MFATAATGKHYSYLALDLGDSRMKYGIKTVLVNILPHDCAMLYNLKSTAPKNRIYIKFI